MADIHVFHDLELSLWQSSVAEEFEALGRADHPAMVATAAYGEAITNAPNWSSIEEVLRPLSAREDDALTSGISHQLALAQVVEDGSFAERMVRFAASVFGKPFEENRDPAWTRCASTYRRYQADVNKGRNYVAPGDNDMSVIPFPADATFGLIGDWGTGEPEAIHVFKQLAALKPDAIIHLGDIYYSGTPAECRRHFLDVIRSTVGYGGPVFILAGNHDYYAAGTGYYDLLKTLNPGSMRQAASFFCLRNDDWQVLAMDTGYHDAVPFIGKAARAVGASVATRLRPDELRWLVDKIENAGARQTILLSHHQLFSAYDEIGRVAGRESVNEDLRLAFAPYLAGGSRGARVRAWLWGHEHDYMTFDRGFKGLPLGACIGHGGIPVRVRARRKPLPARYDGLSPNLAKHVLGNTRGLLRSYYHHGFALLSLNRRVGILSHFEVTPTSVHQIAQDVL